MQELIPPKDAAKRQAFFMSKLQRTSTRLAALMDSRDASIDALFADIDRSVLSVRSSLQAADVQLKSFSEQEWEEIRRRAALRNETECPICMGAFETIAATSSGGGGRGRENAKKRAVLLSCSHVLHHGCLLSFERFTLASSALDGADSSSLLSAQQTQLEAFNDDGSELFQPPPACLCPLCRSNYQKTWL